MAQSNSSSKQKIFLSLKAKVDATNKPYFGKSEKVGDKWQITETYDTISGYLRGAEIKTKEFEGTKKNIFVLTLEDGDETMHVELTHNNVSYSIINTLSGLNHTLAKLDIQVWRNEKDGKFFGNASIKADGEKIGWAFEPSKAPKKIPVVDQKGKPVMVSGKQVLDSEEQQKFFEDVFNDNIIGLVSTAKPDSQKQEVMDKNAERMAETADSGSDDLPF